MFDVLGILYAPGQFIAHAVKRPLRLKVPFLIVLVAALTGMLSNQFAGGRWFDRLTEKLPADIQGIEENMKTVRLGFLLSNVFGTLEYPLTWIIGTGILSCMTVLLEGEGEFRKLLELTGHALVVMALFGVIAVLFALTYHPRFEIKALDASLVRAHPDVLKESVQEAIRGEVESTSFKYLQLVKAGFLLWMAILQAMALKAHSRMSYAKSVASVGAVAALVLVSQLIRNAVAPGGI